MNGLRTSLVWAAVAALIIAAPIGFLAYGGGRAPKPFAPGPRPEGIAAGRVGYVAFAAAPEKIASLVASYAIVALLVERFVMIFLLPNDLEERRKQQAVAAAAARRVESFQVAAAAQRREAMTAAASLAAAPAAAQAAVAEADALAAQATAAAAGAASVQADAERLAQEELIRHSRNYAISALVAGIVLAALGFRVFTQISTLSLPNGMENKFWPEALFYLADVLLSGVLLAGGAQGIHAVVETVAKRVAT